MNIKFIEILENDQNWLSVSFIDLNKFPPIVFQIKVHSIFTFPLPITLAIFVTLLPYIQKRFKATLEVIFILISIHIIYIFSNEIHELIKFFIHNDDGLISNISFLFFKYLSIFTKAMVLRFEPFWIGLYIYLRFKRNTIPQEAS